MNDYNLITTQRNNGEPVAKAVETEMFPVPAWMLMLRAALIPAVPPDDVTLPLCEVI